MKCSSKNDISHSTTAVPVCGSGSSISSESGSFRIRFCIQGFHDQKLKKIQLSNFSFLFLIKNFNLLISRPLLRRRRNLQPSKENNQHFKKMKFINFFQILWSIFDPIPGIPLNPDPLRIHNTERYLINDRLL